MNLVKKAVLFYKQEGFRNTICRIFKKCFEIAKRIPMMLKEITIKDICISNLSKQALGKRVFILIPCIDWEIPLFQRPHQMAVELAKREATLVLFISDQYRYDNFAGYEQIQEDLFLFSHRMISCLNTVLKGATEVVVIMSWMRQAHLLQQFRYHKFVYEYIDDMSLFYYHTPEMEAKHYHLMAEADLTVCTAKALYDKAAPYAKKTILSPNAGDYDFFHGNRNCKVNQMLSGKMEESACVIGYYGCLASWFDYDLILEVARRKLNWYFAFVGYCFDGTAERLMQANRTNIAYIPAQPYSSLPSFVAAFDIQCIPFVINDITRATSPVKLYEYMASGKPILTSELPECMNYRSVWTYKNADDFICKAEQLMQLRNDAAFLAEMDAEARENTWAARVDVILQHIS